jgi:hypothetical protein
MRIENAKEKEIEDRSESNHFRVGLVKLVYLNIKKMKG